MNISPESTLVTLIRGMFEADLGGHILLGGDNARRSYWKAYGGGPGWPIHSSGSSPRLQSEGFTQTEIDQILIRNPAKAFALIRPSTNG